MWSKLIGILISLSVSSLMGQNETVLNREQIVQKIKLLKEEVAALEVLLEATDERSLKREPLKYTVRSGDYLYKIAREFGVEVEQVRVWNPEVDFAKLRRGQVLIMGERELEVIQIEEDPSVATTIEPVKMHQVEEGQTFFAIARKYGVKISDIRRANSEVDPAFLKVGERIVIP